MSATDKLEPLMPDAEPEIDAASEAQRAAIARSQAAIARARNSRATDWGVASPAAVAAAALNEQPSSPDVSPEQPSIPELSPVPFEMAPNQGNVEGSASDGSPARLEGSDLGLSNSKAAVILFCYLTLLSLLLSLSLSLCDVWVWASSLQPHTHTITHSHTLTYSLSLVLVVIIKSTELKTKISLTHSLILSLCCLSVCWVYQGRQMVAVLQRRQMAGPRLQDTHQNHLIKLHRARGCHQVQLFPSASLGHLPFNIIFTHSHTHSLSLLLVVTM